MLRALKSLKKLKYSIIVRLIFTKVRINIEIVKGKCKKVMERVDIVMKDIE